MEGSSQNSGEKKAQLSWSQPPTNSAIKTPAQIKPTPLQSAKTTPAGKSNTARNFVMAGIVVVIVVLGYMLFSNMGSDTEGGVATGNNQQAGTVSGTTVGGASLPDGSLAIPSPQDAGLAVAISKVAVSAPTWVVVYENYNGQPGNVLGAALFTASRTSGKVDLLRGTMPGQTYFVGEARDDGDHMFSMVNDIAVRDTNGNPVLVQFQTK